MPDFTSKQLILPDGPESQDIDQINANSQRINDFGLGPYVCTSATRPTGSDRWDGMLIWQTDNKSLAVYDADLDVWYEDNQGAWHSFTPTLSGSTTNPTLGSGNTVKSKYSVVGKTVNYQGTIIFGSSGVNAGSGIYLISLPILAVPAASNDERIGFVQLSDISASINRIGGGIPSAAGSLTMIASDTNTRVASGVPWMWAAGDSIFWSVIYEAA